MIRKKILLLSALSLFACGDAFAQAVEAVPLSAPDYTLKNETDPMAMDPGTVAPSETVRSRGPAVEAPPPPGMNDQPGAGGFDGTYDAPPPAGPSDAPSAYEPAAPANMDSERAQSAYPNNAVSGVVKTDESKFENRTFCLIKVSFTTPGPGIDEKTADRVTQYLEANTDKLTYRKATWGRHGEFDYCIDVPTHNQRAKVYSGLKKLLPLKETCDKRTVLTGKGFMRVTNAD